MLDQFRTQSVSNSCRYKSEQHFRKTTAQKEGETTAGNGSGETKRFWGVKSMDLFDLIQTFVDLFAGHMSFLVRKTINKLLHAVELGGVYAGIGDA